MIRPSDKIKKDVRDEQAGFRFVEVAEIEAQTVTSYGSFARVKKLDDAGVQIWIPLIASETLKNWHTYPGVSKKWVVAIFNLKLGGYSSSFGMLIPRNDLTKADKDQANKKSFASKTVVEGGKLALGSIFPGLGAFLKPDVEAVTEELGIQAQTLPLDALSTIIGPAGPLVQGIYKAVNLVMGGG